MADLSVTEYVGARATPVLVDRVSILNTIKKAIDDRSRSYVLYITGSGGVGKTFLVREVLRRCRLGGEWFAPEAQLMAAEAEVDLYHSHTHSIEGLLRAMWNVLGSARADLTGYERRAMRFEREKYDLAGMLRELSFLRNDMTSAFLDDLNRLAQRHRLVFALDTAEKLLYETDRMQMVLGLGEEGIAVLPWLLWEFLPKLENSVILVAGRPRPGRLRDDLREALGDRLVELDLPGFETEEDAVAYFDAVAKAVRQAGGEEVADRISSVPMETRRVIWLYTGGRPILLSLMIDYLVMANELIAPVKVPIEEARSKSEVELRQIEACIEAELIGVFQNTGRPADETIRLLVWARKGMDAEMLSHVADMGVERAHERLDELRDLSFVKLRPADNRVFLHDEMYEMLDRQVVARLPRRRRDTVYRSILQYYDDRIRRARAHIAALQQPAAERSESESGLVLGGPSTTAGDADALSRASAQLYSLMAEEVYYRLRCDREDGFKAYYACRQEAFWINDESLDMQLRSEMLTYVSEQDHMGRFDDATRNDVEFDAALAWVERHLRRAHYGQALTIVRKLRKDLSDLVEKTGLLARAQLDISESIALTFLGVELDRAQELLRSAIDQLRTLETDHDLLAWRRTVSLVDALNTLGYLYRTLGCYGQSIRAYRQALPLLRSSMDWEKSRTMGSATEAQYANILNNLGWALAEVGQFRQALFTCQDALEMRQRLGPRAPIALTLNTMGLIQTLADQPHRARVNCENALAIFRDLNQPRGVGLACIALAEALRCQSWASPGLYTPEQTAEFLRRAADHCMEAVDIFSNEVLEHPRLIEALIEQGCVYRDLAAIRESLQISDPDQQTLARRAEDALNRAMREAEEEPGLFHKVVDAEVELAWLHHYMNEDSKAATALDRAARHVPAEYTIVPDSGLPDPELPQSLIWVQLGKMHLLHGVMTMRRFWQSREPEHLTDLETAAYHFTLSLTYAELFAPDFRDIRRGTERIYDSVKRLDHSKEFPAVYRGVDNATVTYNLPTPTRMHRFLDESFGPLIAGAEF